MKNTQNKYPIEGMIIVTILLVAGTLMLYSTGITNINSIEELYKYILENNLFALLMCLFLIFVGISCWMSFVLNKLVNPKKKTVYLVDIDNDKTCSFIDKKGKKYYLKNNDYVLNNYYEVLKTRDFIHEVIGPSPDSFEIKKKKESYWLNFYSPAGNFEDMLLLPIVYIFLIPLLLVFVFSEGSDKIIIGIFMLFPAYLIMYDLIYKLNKNKGENFDESKLINSYSTLMNSIQILAILVPTISIFKFYLQSRDIILLVFLIFALIILGSVIAGVLGNQILKQVLKKLAIILFLIFWFGFLIFFTSKAIKESYELILITIPFWIAGIFVFYKGIIKK